MYGAYNKARGWKRSLQNCGELFMDGVCWVRDIIVSLLMLMIVAGVVVATLSILLEGFVMSTLWGWFIVPMLHGSEPNVGIFSGLILSVGMVISQMSCAAGHVLKRSERPKYGVKEMVFLVVSIIVAPPLYALVIGYVFHLFV
ncbi:hypothetical protein [Ktedonospora formicarum]|uniref:Uncharacterized protein n=1 Tax=Ktedonospora formicarum TaxID=2778364 RepID=A0A8J3I936_9CHLR|nr:hypothetical protein [Ktedonospora formicarum]GHO48277.1 hypothetical protein KSX_64400 [Ktedonospora formicarum]